MNKHTTAPGIKSLRNRRAALDQARTRNVKGVAAKLAADKTITLADLRFRRDLAKHDGDFKLAFALAVAIDKRKGLY